MPDKEKAKRYYGTKDIMSILGVSYTRALQYLHMFEYRGQAFRDGKVIRVEARTFEDYLKSCTGA